MTEISESKKPQKNFWGIGIIISYVCFMSMILFLVFKSTNQKVELMSDDYYKKGVDHQSMINARNNANALVNKPVLIQEKMLLKIPANTARDFFHGKLQLLRPNDQTMDRELDIETTEDVYLPNLQEGAWQLTLHWEDSQKKQYNMQWNIYK